MMALPEVFLSETRRLLGDETADALFRALKTDAPSVSVRLNPLKPSRAWTKETTRQVPWCETGRQLSERPRFTFDPLLHAGCYYVQEAASMFVEQAYRTLSRFVTPRRVLDLCAAPGGKSTLWRSLLPADCLLVANDPVLPRARILSENLLKWGSSATVCTSAFASAFQPLAGFFDVIAADVPCSGEGMFRKDEGAIQDWSPAAVEKCAARQWEIVRDVWPALREGGFMVYSTCTFNRTENEDQVERICRELGAEPVEIPLEEEWGIVGNVTDSATPVCRFLPGRTPGEGFFLALLRKTSATPSARCPKTKPLRQPDNASRKILAEWLDAPSNFRLVQADENNVLALPEAVADDASLLFSLLRPLHCGVPLAEKKGRKYVPAHALALSVHLCRTAFPEAELDLNQALAYLRREPLVLPVSVPRGIVLAVWEGHPLGFLNNLGSRANNLYPSAWRIRHEERTREADDE